MKKPSAPKASTKPTENETLNGSNTLPAEIELRDGVTMPLGDIVMLAHKQSGLSVDAWNALPEGERDGLLNKEIEDARSALATTASQGAAGGAQKPTATSAAKPGIKPEKLGPRALQQVRYRGRTYQPGENLPADIYAKTLDELDSMTAIAS